jgi:hypothetical protein
MEFLDVQLGNGNVLINNNVLKLVIFVMDQKTQQVIIGDQTVMMDQMKIWSFVVLNNQDQIVILLHYVHQHHSVLLTNFNVLINLVLVLQKSVMVILIVLMDLMKDHSVK